MKRISSGQVLKKVREKTEHRTAISFRLPDTLLKDFKAKCKKEKVKMAPIVEELLKNFIYEK